MDLKQLLVGDRTEVTHGIFLVSRASSGHQRNEFCESKVLSAKRKRLHNLSE